MKKLVATIFILSVGIILAQRGPVSRRVFAPGQQQLPPIVITGSPDLTITLTIPGSLVDALETDRLSPNNLGREKCIDANNMTAPCAPGLTHVQDILYPDTKSFILFLLTKPGGDFHRIQLAHAASGSQLHQAQKVLDQAETAKRVLEQNAVKGVSIK